jgi:hypothetical protein
VRNVCAAVLLSTDANTVVESSCLGVFIEAMKAVNVSGMV